MSCVLNDIELRCFIWDQPYSKTKVTLVDYRDGTWAFKIGDYGSQLTVNTVTEDVQLFVNELVSMLKDNEEWQAAETGDANTPWEYEDDPKTDERKTEAWLDN